jgi:hypothetical protein
MNRPFDCSAKSHAVFAITIGLRGNATAIPVPMLMRVVTLAA